MSKVQFHYKNCSKNVKCLKILWTFKNTVKILGLHVLISETLLQLFRKLKKYPILLYCNREVIPRINFVKDNFPVLSPFFQINFQKLLFSGQKLFRRSRIDRKGALTLFLLDLSHFPNKELF